MELYDATSHDISKLLTTKYSSSFSASSLLFGPSIRAHIYDIYGLVRIADEIVDTYTGPDQATLLDTLENETYSSIERGYSTNPIVHSFALTARRYAINKELIAPFFASMRADINPPEQFSDEQYREYIYGSAEVVGLMCLKVFVDGDSTHYEQLRDGAASLGAAYQKVNFLRDFADDNARLNRTYFPGVTYETFDDAKKHLIEEDIERDFATAQKAIQLLPTSSRKAVRASYTLYYSLFQKLRNTPATAIKQHRVRIPTAQKVLLISKGVLKG